MWKEGRRLRLFHLTWSSRSRNRSVLQTASNFSHWTFLHKTSVTIRGNTSRQQWDGGGQCGHYCICLTEHTGTGSEHCNETPEQTCFAANQSQTAAWAFSGVHLHCSESSASTAASVSPLVAACSLKQSLPSFHHAPPTASPLSSHSRSCRDRKLLICNRGLGGMQRVGRAKHTHTHRRRRVKNAS